MADMYEYECSLSGIVAPGGPSYEKDELGDLPVGWTEVKFSRRVLNPDYVVIQQVKQAMIHGLVAQLPEEGKDTQSIIIRVQVEAQLKALQDATPPYITEVETVYLAPGSLSPDVAEAYNEVRESLGLEALADDVDDAEEEEDEDAAVAEEAS
jgi:hypothetical protein